ncbi:hypothetical protein EGI11_03470 [Chryseobacterium sp. H3056]|uniref:Uncharacterized protein n=1 Tax=Kaistella daneshvariae TaxID=2487074 RepID=A0A3N0WXJ5_9FLAO|nr:hypothetical protein [Kaistella daneshvariae]ROI09828.1 hypothetical protein EGI11_03470 [Kaistella daneshvariae]
MKTSFKVLPTEGYINSQFQIITNENQIEIELFLDDQIVNKITAYSGGSTLLTGLKKAGKYKAKAMVSGVEVIQDITVRDAYKLGSSVISKAFVFDDSDISFLSMKDRLMIYNSETNLLVTENLYNPTGIHLLKDNLFLFATRMNGANFPLVNLGIYDTESFTMLVELTGNLQEIFFSETRKLIWLHDKNQNEISCYQFTLNGNIEFKKVKTFTEILNFEFNETEKNVLIETENEILIQNVNNLSQYRSVAKARNSAVDLTGYVYEKNGSLLSASKINDSKIYNADLRSNKVCFRKIDFFYVGEDLLFTTKADELRAQIAEFSEKIIGDIVVDKDYYKHQLADEEILTRSETSYNVYPVVYGFLFVKREVINIIRDLSFRKKDGVWVADTLFFDVPQLSLWRVMPDGIEELIAKGNRFDVIFKNPDAIVIKTPSIDSYYYYGNLHKLDLGEKFQSFVPGDNSYFFTSKNKKVIIRNGSKAGNVVFETDKILNEDTIEETGKIWFVKKSLNSRFQQNEIAYFDLELGLEIPFINSNPELILNTNLIQFTKNYAKAKNNFLFNANTTEVIAPYLGILQGISSNLYKIIILRDSKLYLGVIDRFKKSFDFTELPYQFEKFEESYMSPNGNFLVLKREPGKFEYFDVYKNEVVNFFSGNFLKFSPTGDLVFEEDGTRNARIIDPITLQDVTPSNYQYYKFTSPDGKLHASVSAKTKYYNRITGQYMSKVEYDLFSAYFASVEWMADGPDKDKVKKKNTVYLENFLNNNRIKFEKDNITKIDQIYLNNVVTVQKYIVIGSEDGSFSTEILLPQNLVYYNYAAFSYDNRFFSYVGKTLSSGILALHKLNFITEDFETQASTEVYSFRTSKAAWLCGFSRTHQFAAYDSLPNTYSFELPDDNFVSPNDGEIPKLSGSIKKFKIIHGKNFLCFSPTGSLMGMSEQGYNPISLGGSGHQISNAVHIADAVTGSIISSFKDHGDEIKYDNSKKVSYVFFSEDEKRIMSLSKDGVVVIRNIVAINPVLSDQSSHTIDIEEAIY